MIIPKMFKYIPGKHLKEICRISRCRKTIGGWSPKIRCGQGKVNNLLPDLKGFGANKAMNGD